MPEITTEDIPTLEQPAEQTIRRLRWLAIGCLFLGAQSILHSIYRAVAEHHIQLFDVSWFLVGAAGGLLDGKRGWRKFVLVISWLIVVIAPLGACFYFWEIFSLRQANVPAIVLIRYGLIGLSALAMTMLGAWSIRLLRIKDLRQYFFAAKTLSPPLERRTKWIAWIAALAFCVAMNGISYWWQKKFVHAESWARTTSFSADDGQRMHTVEVLFLYGQTQALVLRNKKGSISSVLQAYLDSDDEPPGASISLPNGESVEVPGKANIFEIIDGEYRETFLEITQEETEAFLDTATYPMRIEDLENFISEHLKNSTTPP